MASNTTDRQLVTVVLLVLGVLVVLPLLFMGGWGMMGGTWSHDMWGAGTAAGWVVVLAVLLRLLFLAAIVVGAYFLYRALTGSGGSEDPALEELRLAYARGDLSDEEYEERRDRLERED